MKIKFIWMFVLILTFNSAICVMAKDDSDSKQKSSEPYLQWISSGESLGKWWLRRSRDYESPNAILYHLDMKYSFNNETGNEELTKHKLNASLTLRKDIFSNFMSFYLKKKEMDYRGSIIKNEKQKFGNTVFIEILPYMDFMGEFQWLTDDKKYYLNRYTYYGGLYFTVLNTKKVIFKIGGFYGHDKIEYMNELFALMGKKIEDPDEDFFSIYQRSVFLITDDITFSEKLTYRSFTGSSDYQIKTNFNLNVKITKHISIDAAYEIDREASDLDQANLNIEKEDRDFTLGIKLSF
ncbi:secreted protein containing DUF481 [Candidatus Magnetomorum sp. HK-1]|nr:secreted protein containing DUF481 [Candidatus Magnetomorum sp. HK-1]